MKKVTKMLFVIAAVIFLFAACGKAEEEPIDVSDVKDIVFGSEIPSILYCSEEKIIIDGTFGVVVYDLENGKLTDRITYDEIHELGMPAYGNFASADGETLYFTDMLQSVGAINSFIKYDIKSKSASEAKEVTEEEFPDGFIGWLNDINEKNSQGKKYNPAEYEKHFQKYKDEGCLIGENSVLLENGEFVFLSIRDGMFYELEIIVCDDNGGEKVYRVFDSTDREV